MLNQLSVVQQKSSLSEFYRHECRENWKKWSDMYKMVFYNVNKLSLSVKLASGNVFYQSKVQLNVHYYKDYVWRLYPQQLVNISHARHTEKEKKNLKKMMNNFVWTAKCIFGHLSLHKHILAVLKVTTNVDTTSVSLT